MSLAAAVRRYVSALTVTQGAGAGSALRVFPWQARFLRGALAEGSRVSALSVARGCGKTTFTAAIACAAADGPLAVSRGEVVIVASSFGQSRIAFEHVLAFLRDKLRDRSRWRVRNSQNTCEIENLETGSRVRSIASDPRRAHGLAPVLVLADEPAQWETAKADRMFSALRTGLGKVPGSRLIALGTRPASTDHFFSKLLDGGADYSQCHAAREGDPITHRRTWTRANPSLAYMPHLEEAIRAEAAEASRDPALLPAFLALRLNLGLSDVSESLLVDAATWREAEGEAEAAGPFVCGVDMGGSVSWSAAVGYWPETGRLEAVAVTGDEPPLGEKARRDGVDPDVYAALERSGELVTTPGRVPPPSVVLEEVFSRWGVPALLVADRWRLGEVSDALEGARMTVPVETRGQGWRDGGQDVRAFRRAILAGRVTPTRSGLLTFSLAEARTVFDPAGMNEKLVKKRGKASRDDPAAAAVLAVAAAERVNTAPAPALRSWVV